MHTHLQLALVNGLGLPWSRGQQVSALAAVAHDDVAGGIQRQQRSEAQKRAAHAHGNATAPFRRARSSASGRVAAHNDQRVLSSVPTTRSSLEL
jgi:hypothetical protein